jgi:hypothetical protein
MMGMRLRLLLCLTPVLLLVASGQAFGQAQPTAYFFTDRASFESYLVSSTTVDFEGVVSDTGVVIAQSPGELLVGDVRFASFQVGVAGPDADITGSPFDSAVLFGYWDIQVDFTRDPVAPNAAGMWFGDTQQTRTATIELVTSAGVLDTRTVMAGDLGAGSSETFYGWIVRGAVIRQLSHDANSGITGGLDNLVYGTGDILGGITSIDMYEKVAGQADFASCQGNTTFFPFVLGLFEFDVWAKLGGVALGGITGAEFRIVGAENIPGWSVSSTPNPNGIGVGSPLVRVDGTHRTNFAFSGCHGGQYVHLYNLTFISTTATTDIPTDTQLRITAGDPPGSPDFDCPLVSFFNDTATTEIYTEGGEFVINPDQLSCTISDIPSDADLNPHRTWTQIKSLYR